MGNGSTNVGVTRFFIMPAQLVLGDIIKVNKGLNAVLVEVKYFHTRDKRTSLDITSSHITLGI